MREPDEDAQLRELVASAIDKEHASPFGVYLFHGDDPRAAIARHLESAVFYDAFGNTKELLGTEYGPYESTSLFCCVIDHRRLVPAGVLRLILPSERGPGLKSFNDVQHVWAEPADVLLARVGMSYAPDELWDVATLAVGAEYRSPAATGLVSLALYQSAISAAWRRGVRGLIAILDEVAYHLSRLHYYEAFVAYGPGAPYLGSARSFPVMLDLDRWEQLLRERDPAMRAIMFDLVGIEAAVRPADVALSEVLADAIGAPRLVERSARRVEGGARQARREALALDRRVE